MLQVGKFFPALLSGYLLSLLSPPLTTNYTTRANPPHLLRTWRRVLLGVAGCAHNRHPRSSQALRCGVPNACRAACDERHLPLQVLATAK